jgi:hypothetical protein
MLKYHGYEDDGVEGYQCLNCYSYISMRHHQFSSQIIYCPFCGCKFEGGFIKDNKHKFYEELNGDYRSMLYKMNDYEYRQLWGIEKQSITYWGEDVIGDDLWEEVFNYDSNNTEFNSDRERALHNLRYNIEQEKEERNLIGDTEVITFRLKYYKYYHGRLSKDAQQNIKYFYPKNNTVTVINEKNRKFREELNR